MIRVIRLPVAKLKAGEKGAQGEDLGKVDGGFLVHEAVSSMVAFGKGMVPLFCCQYEEPLIQTQGTHPHNHLFRMEIAAAWIIFSIQIHFSRRAVKVETKCRRI